MNNKLSKLSVSNRYNPLVIYSRLGDDDLPLIINLILVFGLLAVRCVKFLNSKWMVYN